jgi:GTP-binding protein
VFLGRSNVGKSSLINRLLGTRGLARTSSTPGRTQSVNFYRVNEAFWFVDLPGYGFAKVPPAVQRTWRGMIEGVLERRRDRIAAGVLLVDARHAPTELDRVMRDWLEERGLFHLVAVTKADKLSGNGRAAAVKAAAGALGGEPILASATTGLGMKEIWKRLDQALAGEGRKVRG